MPEQSEIFELNRKYLIGRVVTSTVASGHIAAIEIPSERKYPDITVVYATDFGDCNYIQVMGEKVPILASEEIAYKGQPVLAVFGPVAEDVELFCREVKVSYQITPSGTPEGEAVTAQVYGEPFSWSYGNTKEYFVQGAKSVKSTFSVGAHESALLGDQRIFVVPENGVMNILLGTQWPVNVKKSVATALGYQLDEVCVFTQPNVASYDQFILRPTIFACLAAAGAAKANSAVQMCAPLVSYQPALNFKFESVVSHDEGCVAGRCSCTIDMGAFPVFTKEVFHNVLAGLVPVYPMKALDVKITIVKSSTPPANFFGDLGFAMAQAATENHFTQVALALGKQPGMWRLELLKACGANAPNLSNQVRLATAFDNLPKVLEEVITASWYARKSAANTQKNLYGIKVNPLVNYSKGIGIAAGEGIMGFSQQFNAAMKFSIEVTLTEDNQVIVNTGMQAGKDMLSIWKQTIIQYLNVPEDNIIFMDINDPKIIDLGPNVLSRKIGIVTHLLIQACSEIARKKEFSRLPISVKPCFKADASDPFYFSSCFGAVAVELHLDTVSLSPVIDKVWARFHMGHVFSLQKLINKARLAIFTVISEVFPHVSWQFNIDLDVQEGPDYEESSITAAIRGLTIAALVSAVSQALGRNVNFLPIKETDILTLLKGGKPSSIVPIITNVEVPVETPASVEEKQQENVQENVQENLQAESLEASEPPEGSVEASSVEAEGSVETEAEEVKDEAKL